MVVFANAGEGVLTGQEMIRGQVVFHRYGFGGIPIMNVENACASASTALQTACMAVASGTADVVVAVGAEKLTNADKRRTMAVFSAAVDFDDMPALRDQVQRDLLGIGKEPRVDVVDVVAGPVQSALMEVYAATTRRFFARGGGSAAGAAAVAVCSEERTRSLAAARPVRIDACTLRSGGSGDIESNGAVRRAAAAAYETAGAGPTDVDVAEVHDAAAPAELWTYEQLSLCEAGGAPALLADGSTRLGGRCPVNPSGGLLSRGHPVGATGLAQVVELVDQLRGRCGPRQVDGARLALAQNSGGHLSGEEAVAVVTILSAI